MELLDNLLIFSSSIAIFSIFFGLVAILEKLTEKCPKVERFLGKLFNIELREKDKDYETE